MKRSTFFLVSLASLTICCKSIEVKKTNLTGNIEAGTVYKLPQTQLLFELTVKTTSFTKSTQGCYDHYKQFFAGTVSPALINVLDKADDFTTSKLTAAVISPLPVDDENKIFTLKTKGFNKNVTGLNLDGNGILNKGEFSSENQVIPVLSQIISSAAGFVSPFTMSRAADKVASATKNEVCEELYEKYRTLDAAKTEFLFLSPFKNASQLPTKDLYDRVLTEYENDKLNIFTQLMFSTDVQVDKVVIRYIPTMENLDLVNGKIFFGFKKNNGSPELYINKDIAGSASSFTISSPGVPVLESTEAAMKADKDMVKCYLKIVPVGADKNKLEAIQKKPADFIKAPPVSTDAGGIVYNIPLNCKIYLTKETQNWAEATIMLPQWGTVGRLSNKTASLAIELNPLYGNLKSIKEQSQSVSPDQIKSFGESLAEARDVFYTDPVTKMERRIKFLETKSKLTEAEGTELTELRKQIDQLKAQQEYLELKKALKEFDQ